MTISPLTIMVRFIGQLETMCRKPKHLKHLVLEVLVGDFVLEGEGCSFLWTGFFRRVGRIILF